MRDAAYPLYIISYLLGHQSAQVRAVGSYAALEAALDAARYVEYMKHIQTCRECQVKSKMRNLLVRLTEDKS